MPRTQALLKRQPKMASIFKGCQLDYDNSWYVFSGFLAI